ncbi:hypothetical protein [Brachybacterium sp. FME24]|uniref:hypothetical protein n=1 Tax=Brachybacterium sp. FME24 TaxID=2742605 RepID=UPI0018668717|nr:hypothetical protein [Brachybacterium sp. FME24]
MTSAEPTGPDYATWQGSSKALVEIGDLLVAYVPEGTLRVLLQQLTLHEGTREVGTHEVIDAVTDVGGNLVTFPLVDAVRADDRTSSRLDAAIARLRSDIAEETRAQVEGLEVTIDGDGSRRVRIAFALEISPQDLIDDPAHPALRDGAHHVRHDAPTLDDLRDRLAGPAPSLLQRGWEAVRGWVRRGD